MVEVPNAAVVGAALLAAGKVRADVRARPSSVVEPNETAMGLLAQRRETMIGLVQLQQVAK